MWLPHFCRGEKALIFSKLPTIWLCVDFKNIETVSRNTNELLFINIDTF